MSSFILIGVCILAGMLLKRTGIAPPNAHKGINVWIINVALPAVSFKYLPTLKWSADMLLPALAPVLICLGAWVYVGIYTRRNPVDRLTKGGLQLMASLSNTSFVGFPLILAYFSESDISIAVICDQVTFLLFSSVGLILAVNAQGKTTVSAKQIGWKLITFPPFIGCILALTLPGLIDLAPIHPLFSTLAATVAPLALFSIGLQLSFKGWRSELKHISAILVYKLLIAPVLVLSLVLLFHLKGSIAKISIFEAAMPVILSAGILADEYDLNPKLSNLIIGVSILVGLLTTAGWFYILQYLL